MSFIFPWNKFHCFINTLPTYPFQFKCRLFPKHASKTEQILVRKNTNQDFHFNNTGKTILQAATITKHNLFLQSKKKNNTKQLMLLEDPTKPHNKHLFADKPNQTHPVEAAGRALSPGKGRDKGEFPSPADDTRMTLPKRMLPMLECPSCSQI